MGASAETNLDDRRDGVRPLTPATASGPAGSSGEASVRDPEEASVAGAPAHGIIAPATVPGAVHLTVGDLERSLAFYTGALGLVPAPDPPEPRRGDRPGGTVGLGTGGAPLVVLHEEPGARPPDAGASGLYHFALLLPERADLARWLAHAIAERVPISGAADHFVSEALYLSDPDGHGIEIYRDRPREAWEGRVSQRMTTLPLDLQSLLSELQAPGAERPFEGLPQGTRMGHVHLKVAAIDTTIAFFRDVVGFGLMASLGHSAAFLSAGGYHHHLGANTWESAGGPPPGEHMAALRWVTFVLPDAAERERVLARAGAAGIGVEERHGDPAVRDPSGNLLVLALAGAETA